jgi:glutamyl-tRNA reductase
VRAFEKRKEREVQQPKEKQYRILRERLESLFRWRNRSNSVPGREQMRRFAEVSRDESYQRAVDGVRNILMELAPELFQTEDPVKTTLRDLEATAAIERNEHIQLRTPRN